MEVVVLRDYSPNLGPGTRSKTQMRLKDQQKKIKGMERRLRNIVYKF